MAWHTSSVLISPLCRLPSPFRSLLSSLVWLLAPLSSVLSYLLYLHLSSRIYPSFLDSHGIL